MSRIRTLAIAREYVSNAHETFHAANDVPVETDAFRLSIHLTYLLAHGTRADEFLAVRVSMHAITWSLFNGDGLTADNIYNVLRAHTRAIEQAQPPTTPAIRSKAVGRA